jgi:hypothetical protein
LSACAKTLDSTDEGNIRNDLVVTQYHFYDYHACLLTLKQYAGAAAIHPIREWTDVDPLADTLGFAQ